MTTTVPQSPALLAQADLLLLIADLLRDPRSATLPSAAEARGVAEAAAPEQPEVAATFERLVAAAYETELDAWTAEYHRLFEGSIACPINEAAYIRRDKGAILADVSGFYRAFGLMHAEESGERPDHLRCEIEFIAMLLVMLTQAQERGEDEHREITQQAIQSFFRDHLGEWLESFCARLEETTGLSLYARLSAAARALMHHMAESLDLPAPQPPSEYQPQPEEESTFDMECAMGPTPLTPVTVKGKASER